jgi:hypothetical protein
MLGGSREPKAEVPRAANQGVASCREPLILVEDPLCGRMRGFDRLDGFEPFEFRLAECERLALASVLMDGAELF